MSVKTVFIMTIKTKMTGWGSVWVLKSQRLLTRSHKSVQGSNLWPSRCCQHASSSAQPRRVSSVDRRPQLSEVWSGPRRKSDAASRLHKYLREDERCNLQLVFWFIYICPDMWLDVWMKHGGHHNVNTCQAHCIFTSSGWRMIQLFDQSKSRNTTSVQFNVLRLKPEHPRMLTAKFKAHTHHILLQ